MYITFPGAEVMDRPTGERIICPKCQQNVALINSPKGAVIANHFTLPPPQRGQICDQQFPRVVEVRTDKTVDECVNGRL